MLYAINEQSFDGFHKNGTNIYLVMDGNGKANPKPVGGFIFTSMPLGPAMKQELTGVEDYVHYIQPYETFIKLKDERAREKIAYADPSFFKVFSFKFRYGNAESAIPDLHSMVLTEGTAQRFFGKTNAIGESFQVKIENEFETFIVSAIVENPPSNSSLQFSMLASFGCFENTMEGKTGAGAWGMNSYMTLVQLKPGSRLATDNRLLDEQIRLERLSTKQDSLARLNSHIDFEFSSKPLKTFFKKKPSATHPFKKGAHHRKTGMIFIPAVD